MTNEHKLIETNNRLREQLSIENQKYYENLLLYMRTNSLFHNDQEVEESLLQILQDILEAQANGESAQSYFGQNPDAVADDLLANISKTSRKEVLQLVGIIFGISTLFSLFNQLSENRIDFLFLLLNGLLSFLAVFLLFKVMNRQVYKNKFYSVIFLWVIFSAVLGIYFFISAYTPPLLTVHLSSQTAIILLALLIIVMTGAIFYESRKENKMWWSFTPMIWIMGAFGIGTQLDGFKTFLNTQTGVLTVITFLIVGLLLNFLVSYYLLKKERNH